MEELRTPVEGAKAGDEGFPVQKGLVNGEELRMPGLTGQKEIRASFSGHEKVAIDNSAQGQAAPNPLEEPKMNGIHPPADTLMPNGVANDEPSTSQHDAHQASPEPLGRLPPEIEHITFGFRPMSTLIARLVQETFNDLGEVINEMADVPFPPVPPQLNGMVNHNINRPSAIPANDTSQANVRKKTMMFDFANSRRAQFIKVLVLSKWARQATSISRVIDLRQWLARKQQEYNDAIHWVGMLKRNLANVKEHGPDIKTALEILSLGKASWISNLNYLPPKKITADAMLDGLRRINVLLSIRLKLYENIPLPFRDYTIKSGRVTFKIENECAIDLSIADEDVTKQFYFIDLRLSFSPASSELPTGRLRLEFEARANDVLAQDGLKGLYDYAHNLILTHKLTILRNQAYDLAKAHGSDHVRIERLRRNVVVQYWRERPVPKSWIELGVRRGKSKGIAHSGEETRTSEIALRWFRDAKEIPDPDIKLRLNDLSMTYIMDQVLASHTTFIFSEILSRLRRGKVFANGTLRVKLNHNSADPTLSSLLVQLTASKAIKVSREPISGRLAVLPASSLNSRAETELNRSGTPAVDGAHQISLLRSAAAHEEVESVAQRAGWEHIRSFKPGQEAFQRMFPKGTQRARFFAQKDWDSNWVLAFTTSPDGDDFWVLDTMKIESPGKNPLLTFASTSDSGSGAAYKLSTQDHVTTTSKISLASLAQIERAAAGMISYCRNLRHLALSRIPFRTQPTTNNSQNKLPSIFLKLSQKRAPSLLRSPNLLQFPWAHEVVKLDYQGLDRLHSCAIHTASARVNQLSKEMRDLAANIDCTSYHPESGAFSVSLRSKVGKTAIPQLLHRISGIGRLHEYISIIKAQKMAINRISLHILEFTYQKTPELLKASIHFYSEDSSRLFLSPGNPHLRILDHLNTSLQVHGLPGVLSLLSITLPLLNVLKKLEENHQSPNFRIVSHSEQRYEIRYSMNVGFDIRLRQRRDVPHWKINERVPQNNDPVDDQSGWRSELKTITKSKGEGWRGMNGGIVASISSVQEVVKKLDGVLCMIEIKHTPEASRPNKRKAEGEVVEID